MVKHNANFTTHITNSFISSNIIVITITTNVSRNIVGNEIVYHLHVGAAPTISSFST